MRKATHFCLSPAALLLALAVLSAAGAMTCRAAAWEARVIDADTGRPLPFASVRTQGGLRSVTNAEGWFSIGCDSLESVSVSFVGYSPLTVPAMAVSGSLRLHPMAVSLSEVVVYPASKVVRAVIKEARRQLKKRRRHKATFFYRQTAFVGSECSEVLEAFFCGRAAVALGDLSLQYGRYAALGSDSVNTFSYFANFFTYSQLEIVGGRAPLFWQDVMPLVDNYSEFYKVTMSTISGDGRTIHILRFKPRRGVDRPILDCTLYVDARTYRVLRCKGRGRNMRVLNDVGGQREIVPVDEMTFEETFDVSGGFSEVESVSISVSLMSNGRRSRVRSLMFNVGGGKTRSRARLSFYDNLQNKIDSQGYDDSFWHDNEIVKRTPLEESAVRLFEKRNLFGSF